MSLYFLATLVAITGRCSSAFYTPSVPGSAWSPAAKTNPPPSSHELPFSRSKAIVAMMMSNGQDNTPSDNDIAQQKAAAYNALVSFHETSSSIPTSPSSSQIQSLLAGLEDDADSAGAPPPKHWACERGAVAYGVPMDPAAGLKQGVPSRPYRCSVQVEMEDRGRQGLRLVETTRSDDGAAGEGAPSVPFVRSMPLGANVDVDAADGSYSLDAKGDAAAVGLPLLSPLLLAGSGVDPAAVQFLVEHTVATSEVARCRCFLLYGDVNGGRANYNERDDEEDAEDETERTYRLLGVVFAEETKVMSEPDPPPSSVDDESDDDESDYAAEFISQMIETSPRDPPSSSSNNGNNKDQLMDSLEKHNQRVMESKLNDPAANAQMERHSLGMFGITSGVFLGDTFVRESCESPAPVGRSSRQNKGFGKSAMGQAGSKASDANSEAGDGFATWRVGVQKAALRFDWDYAAAISQSYTYGKFMGAATSLAVAANVQSEGTVVVNEARRRAGTTEREERRVAWDLDGGAYVGGLIADGSCGFRAPRYMALNPARGCGEAAFLTEFLVFFRPVAEVAEGTAPEYYCSRSARLYNAHDGSLRQGSTAFFSMKRPLIDSAEE